MVSGPQTQKFWSHPFKKDKIWENGRVFFGKM